MWLARRPQTPQFKRIAVDRRALEQLVMWPIFGSMHGEPVLRAKRRILFVDDDPRILAGLQGLFRRERARWEMVFALGGRHALDQLGKDAFDVVVTDMRMPEVDGASVLQAVMESSPWTRRILLTGYADDEALARARPMLHQLLDKPCTASTLRDAIEAGHPSSRAVRATRGGTMAPRRKT